MGTAVYAATKAHFIGAVWIAGASMYVLVIPLLVIRQRRAVP